LARTADSVQRDRKTPLPHPESLTEKAASIFRLFLTT
jgi:hypothetical protein